MCRRDLQCLLTSKVFDAILCGGGGEDGGGGGGDDGDIAARGEKSWLLLEGVALGTVVPVCETESVGQARAPTTGDSAGGLYYW